MTNSYRTATNVCRNARSVFPTTVTEGGPCPATALPGPKPGSDPGLTPVLAKSQTIVYQERDGTAGARRHGIAVRSPAVSERMRRVNESVREVVAEGVRALQDPRIGMVTVTGVEVTYDLREATVYVSVLGNEKRRRASLAGLESAHGVLQACINRELTLRRTPQLRFAYDETVERGVRMTKLIDELAPEAEDDDDDPD